jgi:methyl-accepting chemotaxis protein
LKAVRLLRALRGLWNAPHLYSAGVEAEAHLPVLAVLRRQLGETASDVEQAVGSVCESFAGVAQRARETVARAGRLLAGGSGEGAGNAPQADAANMETLVSTSRATIEHLLQRMERGSELSLEAVRRMEELETSIRMVTRAIGEIDAIAFRNKILALNAKIEAVHVGEMGAGFGVVADEISHQARRSNELTEEIASVVSKLRASVEGTADSLRQFATEDRERIAASRDEVRATLDALETVHWQMRASLADTAERSDQLASDISRSIVALQFQDRTNQRIGHVVEALESMELAISGHNGVATDREQRRREVVGEMKQAYTMEAERTAAAVDVPAAAAAMTETKGTESYGEVELF